MDIDRELQTALAHHQAGDLPQAELIYKNIVSIQPDNVDALHLLGVLEHQSGKYDTAIKYIEQALQIDPHFPEAYNNLGNVYKDKGQFDEAIRYYRKAIESNPNFAAAFNNLGNILREKNRFDEAITCSRKAIQIDPKFAAAYNNLGNIYLEKKQLEEAIMNYQKALQYNSSMPEIYNNLGNIFKDKGQLEKAISFYKQAIKLLPSFADAYNNFGNTLKDQGKLDEAEANHRKALEIEPDRAVFFSNLLFAMNYNPRFDAQTISNEHLKFDERYAKQFQSSTLQHTNEPLPHRGLKIGYVSPDFKGHSVSFFIEPVLSAHTRDLFEIFCYSDVQIPDKTTRRIQEYSDQWRDITGMSDNEVAGLIRKDMIDILIDLAGHTAYNRILLFARKPAPLQISWIGYPGTTGLKAMDYKIVDNYTDPIGMTEKFYTEKLLRLPESFLCYQQDKDTPGITELPAIAVGHVTFGSFNNFSKVSSEAIALWSGILRTIPDSRLIMKTKSLSDENTRNQTVEKFLREGISTDRIDLLSWEPTLKGHLEIYNRIDIALDTFPYNGTTTTCEALWMGVPVISLAGSSHISRVGVSLLSNAGIPEFIARSADEYADIAIKLTQDLSRLKMLRGNLRHMLSQSPLCNTKRFMANLEQCYRIVWENWCNTINS